MAQSSPVLALPYIQPSQAQKHVTHNEALRLLDAVTQLVVLSADQTEPPADPAEGDRHVVASGGTGDWAGQDGKIAVFVDTAWQYVAPLTGWRADVAPTGESLRFDGAEWVAPEMQNLPLLGVATSADAINRLAVAAEATLLSHDGAGHQLKINKDAAADTASLLFQTSFSGRAELGTTGSDDFTVKVSADGSAFRQVMLADAVTGRVVLGTGIPEELLTVAANATEPTVQVRNLGGAGGATFRMTDDLSGGDWKFKITNDGTFKLRNHTDATDVLLIEADPHTAVFTGPVRLPAFTVATLPAAAAAGAGAQVFVSDETGGPVPAFSDGTDWRRVTDRAIVA